MSLPNKDGAKKFAVDIPATFPKPKEILHSFAEHSPHDKKRFRR